jgi:nucleoside-diphosphate-sugar epimerase
MKIAITGHTSGIGQAIYNHAVLANHSVNGFSRSNGFDISRPSCRQQILKDSCDIDIFINNAYSAHAQTELLTEAISQWQGSKVLIVNISSAITLDNPPDYAKNYISIDPTLNYSSSWVEQYQKDKKQQNQICQRAFANGNVNILNVILGVVDTPMMQNYVFSKKLDSNFISKILFDRFNCSLNLVGELLII